MDSRKLLFERMGQLRAWRDSHNRAKPSRPIDAPKLTGPVTLDRIPLLGECCEHITKAFDNRYKSLLGARTEKEFESIRRREAAVMQKLLETARTQSGTTSFRDNEVQHDLVATMMEWADELCIDEVEAEVELFMMRRSCKDFQVKEGEEKSLDDQTSSASGEPQDVEALYDDVDPTKVCVGPMSKPMKIDSRDKLAEMKRKLQMAKQRLLDARQRQESTTSSNDGERFFPALPDVTALSGPPLVLENIAESGPAHLVGFIVVDPPRAEEGIVPESPTLATKKRKAAEVNLNIEILKRRLALKKKKKDKSGSKPASPIPPALDKDALKKRQEEVKASMEAANWANLLVKQQKLLRDAQTQIDSVNAELKGVDKEVVGSQAQLAECDRVMVSYAAKESYLEDRIARVARELVLLRALREEARDKIAPESRAAPTSGHSDLCENRRRDTEAFAPHSEAKEVKTQGDRTNDNNSRSVQGEVVAGYSTDDSSDSAILV